MGPVDGAAQTSHAAIRHLRAILVGMSRCSASPIRIARALALDLLAIVRLSLRSQGRLAAENLFLRKQLALCLERQVRPRRPDAATRATLALLARVVDWKSMLTVVTPDTLLRWHRAGWRLFWRWQSTPRGRPRIPADLQRLIREMARANRMKSGLRTNRSLGWGFVSRHEQSGAISRVRPHLARAYRRSAGLRSSVTMRTPCWLATSR